MAEHRVRKNNIIYIIIPYLLVPNILLPTAYSIDAIANKISTKYIIKTVFL